MSVMQTGEKGLPIFIHIRNAGSVFNEGVVKHSASTIARGSPSQVQVRTIVKLHVQQAGEAYSLSQAWHFLNHVFNDASVTVDKQPWYRDDSNMGIRPSGCSPESPHGIEGGKATAPKLPDDVPLEIFIRFDHALAVRPT